MTGTSGHKLEKVLSILTLGAGLLALFLGVENWWLVFVVGFAVLVPLVQVLFDDAPFGDLGASSEGYFGTSNERRADESRDTSDTRDALDTLRDRYARGELSEEAFERKVERLLETETLEDARERVGRTRDGPAGGEREWGRSTEREPER